MGHEVAGAIAAIGPEVSGFAVGRSRDLLIPPSIAARVIAVSMGEVNLCNNRQVIGVSCALNSDAPATFAEYVIKAPARIV